MQRQHALVRPFHLKANVWAIWGNFDFSIFESKFQLHALKRCYWEHSIPEHQRKWILAQPQQLWHLGKHLAESTYFSLLEEINSFFLVLMWLFIRGFIDQ